MEKINTNTNIITNYHHLSKGDMFTLIQLQNKLAEWERIYTPSEYDDEGNCISSSSEEAYGWNLVDRDQKWDRDIPEVGSTFKLYISEFFSFRTYAVKVLRQEHDLFLVVEEE